MQLAKRLFKHPITQHVAAWLLHVFIRLAYVTNKKTFLYDEKSSSYMSGKQNAIFAFWHGRMMMVPLISPKTRILHALTSQHRDGKLIANTVKHFGHKIISGSTSRGGKEALKKMLSLLKDGDNIGITPDGPRGPNQKLSEGIITLARLSNKPIIPVAFSSSHYKRLNSWDKFMLVIPFGRIVFCVGAPIMVNRDNSDGAQNQVEQAMNVIQKKADEAAGAEAVNA